MRVGKEYDVLIGYKVIVSSNKTMKSGSVCWPRTSPEYGDFGERSIADRCDIGRCVLGDEDIRNIYFADIRISRY